MKLFGHAAQVAFIAFFFVLFKEATPLSRFLNATCTALAPEYGDFEDCSIKELSPKRNVLNIVYTVKQSMTNTSIHLKLFKKSDNEWRPFMVDTIVYPCEYLKNPNMFMFSNLINDFLHKYTNSYHKCPFKTGERITLKDMDLNDKDIFGKFSLKNGEYGFSTKWSIKRTPFLSTWISVKYTEK